VILGASLGILFGASSIYLVLRVGMTVSASIPVAVLAITLFRWLSRTFQLRQATILENNITQTTGSAGESIAFGVGVTMPALMLLGFDMDIMRVMVISILGGLLGILMMIPLRRAFIVNMHGKLPYPEGTACAEVLISGEKGGTSGSTVFIGFGVAFALKFIIEGMSILATTIMFPLAFFNRAARISTEAAPELIGVGYVIGLRIAAVMMAGAVIGNLVLVPTIAQFTDTAGLSDGDFLKFIQGTYLRYIGAGCVTAAGIISMFKTMPMIVRSFRSSLSTLRSENTAVGGTLRTDRDMPVKFVALGAVVLLALLGVFLAWQLGSAGMEGSAWKGPLGALLVLLFGFLFVTVSSRLTGEIGSSSNPISGMTIAALAMTCLIFLGLGMTSPVESVVALSVGAVVCIAASNGGTTSQDLKTGFLVGGTPQLMQYAILIGALSSALVIGLILIVFNQAGTVITAKNLPGDALPENIYAGLQEKANYQKAEVFVWRAKENNSLGAAPGSYLVGADKRLLLNVTLKAPPKDHTIEAKDLEKIKEKFTYEGKEFVVWRPTKAEASPVGEGVFLADTKGNLLHELTSGPLPPFRVKGEKLAALQEKTTHEGESFTIWRVRGNDPTGVPAGKYYLRVGPDFEGLNDIKRESGTIAYLEDPGITGKVSVRDDGSEVKMKFDAPKTAVIGIIINGVLEAKLNWGLILIGVMLAIGLELCGIGSLAFAVGVYIPMQYTTPIFLGGIIRWIVDSNTAQPKEGEDEAKAIAQTETGPGVLLASGYIAGGSIAGVLIAFLELPFFETIKNVLNFSVENGPRILYPITGIDLAPVPIVLGLLVFLALVGMGKMLKPKT
jgi:putative OPT family oligopeptide transporter